MSLGVSSFANTGLRDAFNEMGELMFECVKCGVKSNAQLVCSACQKPLPALDEMTEFLEMW
eukprot:13032323-Alexandrium_andersonii.AAC.1